MRASAADGERRAGGVSAGAPSGRWCRDDWTYAAWIAGVPAVLLGLAALVGYPIITGDDLIQNLPLEALAGQIVAHGHLPLYNAYLWSGTPLLAGANAHALLPITLLFAAMPPLPAWVAGEVIVLAGAAIGCQLFLRRTGCHPGAAALGGASFGLGGFVSSQIVHIDFAAGAAALPWALVALHGLAFGPASSRLRHCLLLSAATSWVALTGSPDIVIDAAVVWVAYAVHALLPAPARPGEGGPGAELPVRTSSRLAFLLLTAVGAGAGLAVGALQWLPTALFFDISQRSEPTFSFISGGSLSFGNVLELLVPHVMGGGLIGLRHYAGTYALAEVDAYPGMMALIAAAVMAVRIARPRARRWRVWLVVAATGLCLALGSHTPVEHLVARLPVAGDQRLPSRALVTVALALSLLLGYFLDEWPQGRAGGGRPRRGRRIEIAAALVPVAGTLAVVIATISTGRPAGGLLAPSSGSEWSLHAVAPALALSAVLALGGFLLFALAPLGRRRDVHLARRRPSRRLSAGRRSIGRHSTSRRLPPLVAAFVLADLGLFVVNQSSLAPAPISELSAHGRLESEVAALAGNGRALIVDPELTDGTSLAEAGAPDVGILSGLREAGGYSSIAWGRYTERTGTHTQDGASPAALADGTFAALGVRVVLLAPNPAASGTIPTLSPGADRADATEVLRAALRKWQDAGRVGPFLAFVDPHPAPIYELVRRGADPSVSAGAVRVLSSSPLTGATTLEVVSPRPAELVRDVADIPGWRATVRRAGAVTSPRVGADGLVQSVPVPAGTSVVSFSYVPPGWRAAQAVAAGGALVAAGLALGDAVTRRRRPRRGGRARPVTAAELPAPPSASDRLGASAAEPLGST